MGQSSAFLLAVSLAAVGLCASAQAGSKGPRTDWFSQAGYGVFVHYLVGLQNNEAKPNSLGKQTTWDQCVKEFDVEAFADQVAQAGAGYVIFTMHQITRHLAAPNATYDRLTGYKPGEACATRDLVADLYGALHPRNVRLILYWTGDGPRGDRQAATGLGYPYRGGGHAKVTTEFVRNWAAVAAEYGERYGDKIAGWWCDGCYPRIGYDKEKLAILARGLRAGSDRRILALNAGVQDKVRAYSEQEDFTTGEQNHFKDVPTGRWVHGEQWHVLSYLGGGWGMPGSKYSRQQLIDYVYACNRVGGVVSIDVMLRRDGRLDGPQLEILKALRPGLKSKAALAEEPKRPTPVPLGALAPEGPQGRVLRDEARRIVSRHKAVFTLPPRRVPSRTQTDAPLLGNGDMGVALGGPPEAQRLWLAKNDFWRLKSRYKASGPRVFGGLDVSVPELKGASYRVEQSLYDAVTEAVFTRGDLAVKMRAWVAATKNVLVVELSAHGRAVPAEIKLQVAEGDGSETAVGTDAGVYWVSRKFVKDVDIPSGAAAAVKVIGADGLSLTLRPGKPVTVALAMASVFKHKDYADVARKLAGGLDEAGIAALRQEHAKWWRGFWGRSFVELDDPAIEQRYYLSHYVMASCSRDPEFPPGIFGTWVTTDSPAWAGDYHLNYNHMAPFYGLYSSNHIEQADPYHAPILDFMEQAKAYAQAELKCRGVYYPVGIGPKGIETSRGGTYDSKGDSSPGLFCGQKSNAGYCLVNVAARWQHTYDPAYARKLYPFVREVATFWEDYLKWDDAGNRYVIENDAVHENTFGDFNPIVSLAFVRLAMETAIDMSTELGIDRVRHEKWRHILQHLSGFATQEMGGKTVFRYTERGTAWWRGNTLGIQHIYPAGAIGLDSEPELLRLARNTIEVMGRWVDNNGSNSFFPAAVRVGYDPAVILKQLHEYVARRCQPNGFAANNPHGIENCSIVPNTINMMLCMGHQDVLRVFGVWPRDRDARFASIRARGAFLVSSERTKGEVRYVMIRSERGRPCTLVNPWPGKAVVLYRGDRPAETLRGERVKFATSVGEEVLIGPADTSQAELRSRLVPPGRPD